MHQPGTFERLNVASVQRNPPVLIETNRILVKGRMLTVRKGLRESLILVMLDILSGETHSPRKEMG
jgi:hypothetical protein